MESELRFTFEEEHQVCDRTLHDLETLLLNLVVSLRGSGNSPGEGKRLYRSAENETIVAMAWSECARNIRAVLGIRFPEVPTSISYDDSAHIRRYRVDANDTLPERNVMPTAKHNAKLQRDHSAVNREDIASDSDTVTDDERDIKRLKLYTKHEDNSHHQARRGRTATDDRMLPAGSGAHVPSGSTARKEAGSLACVRRAQPHERTGQFSWWQQMIQHRVDHADHRHLAERSAWVDLEEPRFRLDSQHTKHDQSRVGAAGSTIGHDGAAACKSIMGSHGDGPPLQESQSDTDGKRSAVSDRNKTSRDHRSRMRVDETALCEDISDMDIDEPSIAADGSPTDADKSTEENDRAEMRKFRIEIGSNEKVMDNDAPSTVLSALSAELEKEATGNLASSSTTRARAARGESVHLDTEDRFEDDASHDEDNRTDLSMTPVVTSRQRLPNNNDNDDDDDDRLSHFGQDTDGGIDIDTDSEDGRDRARHRPSQAISRSTASTPRDIAASLSIPASRFVGGTCPSNSRLRPRLPLATATSASYGTSSSRLQSVRHPFDITGAESSGSSRGHPGLQAPFPYVHPQFGFVAQPPVRRAAKAALERLSVVAWEPVVTASGAHQRDAVAESTRCTSSSTRPTKSSTSEARSGSSRKPQSRATGSKTSKTAIYSRQKETSRRVRQREELQQRKASQDGRHDTEAAKERSHHMGRLGEWSGPGDGTPRQSTEAEDTMGALDPRFFIYVPPVSCARQGCLFRKVEHCHRGPACDCGRIRDVYKLPLEYERILQHQERHVSWAKKPGIGKRVLVKFEDGIWYKGTINAKMHIKPFPDATRDRTDGRGTLGNNRRSSNGANISNNKAARSSEWHVLFDDCTAGSFTTDEREAVISGQPAPVELSDELAAFYLKHENGNVLMLADSKARAAAIAAIETRDSVVPHS